MSSDRKTGYSYQTVLSEIFDIDEEFGGKTQEDLDEFYKIVRNGKKINEKELLNLAKSLAIQSEELDSIVQIELRQLSRRNRKRILTMMKIERLPAARLF